MSPMSVGRIVALLLFLVLFPPSVSAAQITASSDKVIYAIGDVLTVEGTVNSTASVNLTATFYYDNGTEFDNTTTSSENRDFNFSYALDVSAGGYYILITDGTDFVPVHFKVVPESIRLEAHLVNSTAIIPVNTSETIIDGAHNGGNFTELLDLSISKTLHYGNRSIDDKTYHFVLVDQNLNESYDTLYVDDDNIFQLYNDTEDNATNPDVEIVLKKGDPFKDYIIGEVDFNYGGTVLLANSRGTPRYSPGDEVNFMVLAKNAAGDRLPNKYINATLLDKSRSIISSTANTTNDFGYFITSFTAPSSAGSYIISLNDSMGIELLFVETFKLSAKITDLNNNPTGVFAPNPKMRITAISKNPSGTLINLTSASALIYYPNGSSAGIALTQTSAGIYSRDLDFTNAPYGEYSIKITGGYETDTQEIFLGFSIESVGFEVLAINTDFIDESDGPEAMVNAFAPNKNITLLAVLSDVASGGLMASGPEGMKTIPIDNASTARDECEDLTLVELVDDMGVSYSVNISSMNLTSFIESLPEGPPPPEEQGMLSQCMVVFKPPTNRTAVYRAALQIDYQGRKKIAGETFGVQRLYAAGSTVDFNGEDFKFFAPNTTVRIKLRVTDLSTLEELNASKILDAKITKMEKHFPSYNDVAVRNITDQNIATGVLSFTAPNDEGFFSMRFRFKANLSGSIESGVGNVFFMLKKYMIWGEPVCQEGMGPCIFASTSNISLNINIVDIDQGARLDMGQTSGLSCTGCDGLVVDIGTLMNEQLGKEIPSTDFNVTGGTVINSSAALNITSTTGGLPPGWYGVELIVTNPANQNESYFGFAWFEARNFFVETVPVWMGEDGNLTIDWGRRTYPVGDSVTFGIIPRDPAAGWGIIPPTQVPEIQNVLLTAVWPPLEVQYNYTAEMKNVTLPWCEECPPIEIYMVNLTDLGDEGNYRANVKVTTSKGSDIGGFDFGYASYYAEIQYRGMEDWPPVFGPDEILNVTILGKNFNKSEHKLSINGTRLKMLYDIKKGRPIKVNKSYINKTHPEPHKIKLEINLPGHSLSAGDYWGEIVVNDTEGVTKQEGIYFVVKDLVVGIPSINELWTGWKDSPERELDINNNGDRCDNERWLKRDEIAGWDATRHISDEHPGVDLQVDDCPGDATKVCVDRDENNNPWNVNFTLSKDISSKYYVTLICLFDNGTIDGDWGSGGPCKDKNRTAIIANDTDVWINDTVIMEGTSVINMTGITPNAAGETATVRGRTWYVYDTLVEGTQEDKWNRTGIRDKNVVRVGVSTGIKTMAIPDVLNRNNGLYAGSYCFYNNGTIADSDHQRQLCPSGEGTDYYFVSNGTNATIWVYNNLTEPIVNGTANVSFAGYTIVDVGYNGDGNTEAEKFRIINTSDYGKIQVDEDTFDISYRYPKALARAFCIDQYGEWRDGACSGAGNTVYAVSNYTHIWVNSTTDMTATDPKGPGEDFNISGDDREWHVVSVGGENEEKFRVSLSVGRICGRGNKDCTDEGCTEFSYIMVPPSNYSNFYHGYVRDLKGAEWLGNEWGPAFNETRWVYVYHNTSHLWMTNNSPDTPNLSAATPKTVGELISDPYGGIWKVASISKHRTTLRGQNVLAQTGAYINISLSKSGNIKLERVEERWLGGWDERAHRERGLDMNGDGLTNTTFFVAIVDNATAGVYDTFFFSNGSNFSNPVSINDNIENRTFGLNDTLTLLSIDPRANRVRAYSNRTSDWAELGDFKVGTNVTIPVIVSKPSGEPTQANISIENVRRQVGFTPSEVVPLGAPVLDQFINGAGEISINISESGLESGEFAFEITASRDGTEERLEEWKWPRATMRTFLADMDRGFGGYVSGFKQLPLYRYDWESYGEIDRIKVDNRNKTNIVEGIIETANPFNYGAEGCIAPPICNGFGGGNNCTIVKYYDEDIYFVVTKPDKRIHRNDTSCNLTGSETSYGEGDSILLNKRGRVYNLTVLKIDIYETGGCGSNCWRASFGVPGVDSSIIEPMRNDTNNPDWGIEWGYMQDVNAGGLLFDVILANDTTLDYPMCSAWNIQECTKKAWFSTDGNFSNAIPARIGENFTSDLYLARVGPGPWEGMSIGNFSEIEAWELPMYPGADVRMWDNTTSYFAKIAEGTTNLDLNMDGSKDDTFYAVAFDHREDGIKNATEILTDDDLNITEPWWSTSGYYKDFYGNESGTMSEKWHGLPRGIYDGHTAFGDKIYWNESEIGVDWNNDGVLNETMEAPWEYQPEWEIKMYNNTDMLLLKHRWIFNVSDNVTLISKVYNFEQTPIEGANITVTTILGDVPGFGFTKLSESDYTAQSVLTDQYGYAVVKIAPANEWKKGQYMVSLKVTSGGKEENIYEWFRVSEGYEWWFR